MNWVKVNERLLEMERNKKDTDEWRKEWNNLLSLPIAGILKRQYEKSKGEKTGERKDNERRKRRDVAAV